MATAKEKLRERLDGMSEEDARAALAYLERIESDPVFRAFEQAPEDDEPLSPEEEAALAEDVGEAVAGGGCWRLRRRATGTRR